MELQSKTILILYHDSRSGHLLLVVNYMLHSVMGSLKLDSELYSGPERYNFQVYIDCSVIKILTFKHTPYSTSNIIHWNYGPILAKIFCSGYLE